VLWLTDGSSKQRCYCFKRRRERFLLFPSPPFSFPFSGYVSFSFCSCLCVCFSTPVPLLVSVSSLSLISHSPSLLFPASPFSFFVFFRSLSFSFFSFSSLRSLFFFSLPRACWRWVVFIGQKERGCPYCRPIVVHGEQGFVALPWRRVGWPVGVAGRARLPRSLIMRVRGASGLAEHAGMEMGMKN